MYHYKVVTRGSLPPNPCDDQLVSYFHEMNTFGPDYGSSWGMSFIRRFGSVTAKVLRCVGGARGQCTTEVA